MDNPENLATMSAQNEERQNKNTTHHFAQTNTNNINKTRALLQTTGGKDEPVVDLALAPPIQ